MRGQRRKSVARKLMKKGSAKLIEIPIEEARKREGYQPWMQRIWRSNRFCVWEQDVMMSITVGPHDHTYHAKWLMVQQHDNRPIQNHWRSMQWIREQLYPEYYGVEYYPPTEHLIDDQNIYWMMIVPHDFPIPNIKL